MLYLSKVTEMFYLINDWFDLLNSQKAIGPLCHALVKNWLTNIINQIE